MRLVLLAPGETTGTRAGVFGDRGDLLRGPQPPGTRLPAATFCGPEPACVATASALPGRVGEPRVIADLAAPDFGRWTGLGLEQLVAEDPSRLGDWLRDPTARPHGGESLVDQLSRVGALLDATDWPQAGAVLVASSFTLRAACVHALGGGPQALMHLDVPPSCTATISRHAGTWRLQALIPPRNA